MRIKFGNTSILFSIPFLPALPDMFLQFLLERFADRFDNLDIFDASNDPGKFKSLLKIEQQQLIYLGDDLPARVEQTVINIADRYRNNSKGEDNDDEQGRD